MTTIVEDLVYPEEAHSVTGTDDHLSWIILLRGNLRAVFHGQNVYIGGDIFWYPVEGEPRICASPDALAVFGRPQYNRRTWQNWHEEGLGPQVTVEVLSVVNKTAAGRRELANKVELYQRHGVEEYIELDPDRPSIVVWLRGPSGLVRTAPLTRWVSPRLNVTFAVEPDGLNVYGPDGARFVPQEDALRQGRIDAARAQQEAARAQQEAARAQQEADRANREAERATDAEAEVARLRAEIETLRKG